MEMPEESVQKYGLTRLANQMLALLTSKTFGFIKVPKWKDVIAAPEVVEEKWAMHLRIIEVNSIYTETFEMLYQFNKTRFNDYLERIENIVIL